MEDLTSYDKAKKLVFWYLIGLGDKKWTNDLSGLGVSIVPLSVVKGINMIPKETVFLLTRDISIRTMNSNNPRSGKLGNTMGK